MFFLFLDQENISLSFEELKCYYKPLKIIGPLVIVDKLNFTELALTKYYGKFLGVFNNIEEVDLNYLKGQKVGIKVLGNRKKAKEIQKYLTKKFNLNLSFDKKSKKLFLFFYNNFIYFGEIIKEKEKFWKREPKNRPFNRPYSLKPKFAKVLVNLANDNFIVDPFVGTGTIIIEAFYLGKKFLGIDKDWKAVKGCMENLKFFKAPTNVILSNAFYINNLIKKPFSIVCDPPYGKSSTSFKEKIYSVYDKFLKAAFENNNLNNLVIIAPKHFQEVNDLLNSYKPTIKVEHFVNNALTRVIYVFKNKKCDKKV